MNAATPKNINKCQLKSKQLAGANTTITTNIYTSSDVPKMISSSGSNTTTSTILVPSAGIGILSDINLVGLDISHSFVDDLTIKLRSPQGTEINLVSGLCSFHDDIQLDFDDSGGAAFSIPCPPTDNQAYAPTELLSHFNNENPVGVWTLIMEDRADLDGGTLNGWALEITTESVYNVPCAVPNCNFTHNTIGSCIDYTLNAGDTLCINADYNCTVTINNGALVYVAAGVDFSPDIGGEIRGTVINCGTTNLGGISLNVGTIFENNGVWNFNGNVNSNGAAQFLNKEGGIMNFNSNFSLNNNSILVNFDEMNVVGNLNITNGTKLTNNHVLLLAGSFTTELNGTTINNGQVISRGGDININTSSTVINNCTFSAANNIILNENLQNNGLLYTVSGDGNIYLNNSSILTNNGDVVCNNLELNGVVEGNGDFWITENTTLNNSGNIGNDGKGLNIFDSSTPPFGQFFDTQNGTVFPSVTNLGPTAQNPIPTETSLTNTCSNSLIIAIVEICNNGIDDDFDGAIDCQDDECCCSQAPVLIKHN